MGEKDSMKTALLVLAIIALAFAQSTNPDIVGSDPVTTPDEQGPSPDGNPDPIYAQYSEGLCEGSDCCELVKSCLKDLKVNANIDDPEIGAPWRTGSRCPFPVCAHGYHYDPLGLLLEVLVLASSTEALLSLHFVMRSTDP